MEEWKKVLGFDYDYEVSNFGRVRCLNPFRPKNSILYFKGNKDVYGYLRVGLTKNKKVKTIKIHRLVCQYFLPQYDESLTVNHKDYNKQNNHIDNLEMMSSSENVLDYQLKVVSKKSKCSVKGVIYHSGISKWVARVTINGKRYNLGSFFSEQQAIYAIENQEKFSIKIGKGPRIGYRKYSKEFEKNAFKIAQEIGVRKAAKQLGISPSTISRIRREARAEL